MLARRGLVPDFAFRRAAVSDLFETGAQGTFHVPHIVAKLALLDTGQDTDRAGGVELLAMALAVGLNFGGLRDDQQSEEVVKREQIYAAQGASGIDDLSRGDDWRDACDGR